MPIAPATAPHSLRLLHHLSFMTLLEGGSLIALVLIAVPIKYALGEPLGVKIIGPIHGAFFVWTIGVLVATTLAKQLGAGKAALVFLAALIPFGGLWSHHLLDQEIDKKRTTQPSIN